MMLLYLLRKENKGEINKIRYKYKDQLKGLYPPAGLASFASRLTLTINRLALSASGLASSASGLASSTSSLASLASALATSEHK